MDEPGETSSQPTMNGPVPNGPVGNTATGGDRSWERAWTVEEMRKNANNWSLAGDAGLLQYLQEFSQRMSLRTHDIEQQVNGLVHEVKMTGVKVKNSFNDFIMLANTQFVENRVYDEDVSQSSTEDQQKKSEEKTEKTREEKEAELIPKVTEALRLGVDVINTAFEKLDVDVANSDSEDEETPYATDPILEAKDPYLSRPLPHLIGSYQFLQYDDCGLTEAPSEDEAEEDQGSLSESESEDEAITAKKPEISESSTESEYSTEEESEEENLFGQEKAKVIEDIDEYSTDEETDEEEAVKADKKPKPQDFTSELASKLGQAPPPTVNEDQEEKSSETKKHKKKSEKKTKSSKKTMDEEEDLFAPPPEDEDSPFGKAGGLFSSSKGLFDDDVEGAGLFDDVVIEKKVENQVKNKEPKETAQEEQAPPEPKSRSGSRSGKKMPAGAVSIFGGGDDDLFSAGKQEPPEMEQEEEAPRMSKGGGGGLFDDEDEDDLFAAPSKPAAPASAAPVKQVAAPKTVDLFAADDEEDGGLFSAAPRKSTPSAAPAAAAAPLAPTAVSAEPSPEREPSPKKETAPSKPQKKLPAGAVSMFGSGPNPFAAAIKAQKPPSSDEDEGWSDEEAKKPSPATLPPVQVPAAEIKKSSPAPSTNSLFAEEPEIDTPPELNKTKPSKPASKPASGLFDDADDEDLFSAAASAAKKPSVSKGRSASLLFDDEEGTGDLFSATKPAVSNKKKPPAGGVALFGGQDVLGIGKKEEEKAPEKPAPAKKKSLSLFDENGEDDDVDMFSPTSAPPPLPEPQETKARSRSLFEDEDILFSGPSEEDPNVDLFGNKSPLKKPTKQEASKPKTSVVNATAKPFPGATKTPTPASSSKKKSSAGLFGDDDEDDLFASPSQKPDSAAKNSIDVAGVTAGSSSTDLFNDDAEPDIFAKPAEKPSLVKNDAVTVAGVTAAETSTDVTGPAVGVTADKQDQPPEPAPAASHPKPKRPPGAVSMFGGLDPASLIKRKSKDEEPSIPKEPPPEVNITPEVSPSDPLGVPLPTEPPKRASVSKPSAIGKLKANLAINPGALLPGATPPVKEAEPQAVGFDQPATANTLHSAVKTRAKIQTKRRPPSRIARQKSADANPTAPALEVPPSDRTEPEPAVKAATPPAVLDIPDDFLDLSREPPPMPSENPKSTSKPKNVSTDIFGNDDLLDDSRVPPPLPNLSDNEDDTTNGFFNKPSVAPSRDALDDLFSAPKSSAKKDVFMDDDDDIFSTNVQPIPVSKSKDVPKAQVASQPLEAPSSSEKASSNVKTNTENAAAVKEVASPAASHSPPPLDDDIFADSTVVTKKAEPKKSVPVTQDNDDIFADSSVLKKRAPAAAPSAAVPPPLDDDDDIFAPSSRTRKPKKAVTKDEDLFKDDTDIFADLPPSKPKEKKTKKKTAEKKSIFKDDVDDIFADSSTKPKTKKSSNKKATTSKKDPSIFDDNSQNIFDDPLSAMKN